MDNRQREHAETSMRSKRGLSIAGLIVAVSILAGNLSIYFFDPIPGLAIGSQASPTHSTILRD